jgi:signal transduction histidine kinase
MTIPAYTPPGLPDASVPVVVHRPLSTEGGRRSWRAALRATTTPFRTASRAVQWSLDIAGIGFAALAFAHTPLSAEFLFHGVFVVLALHAFLFGLRGTLFRIGIASLPLLVYANAATFGFQEQTLELSEWPLMFVIAVIVASMADKRKKTSRLYAARFRQASERLLTVQDDERRRLAGELHDGVGQVLTALTLTLDAASAAPQLETSAAHVRVARHLADTALGETRDLAHRMRPVRSEERGLVPALRDLAKESGFPVRVVADAESVKPKLFGPTATVEVYRIIQEALANAARHSGAPGALVSLSREGDRMIIEISDDGRGFNREDQAELGIGLAGMEERAALLDGRLVIASKPGHGTRVTLSIPTAGEPGANR